MGFMKGFKTKTNPEIVQITQEHLTNVCNITKLQLNYINKVYGDHIKNNMDHIPNFMD